MPRFWPRQRRNTDMLFSDLAEYFKAIEATPSRNEMTQQLAELFGHAHVDEIDKLCYLLQGRVVPLYEAVEFGMAEKFVIRAIALAYNVSTESVHAAFKKAGDVGIAAESMYAGKYAKKTVSDVYNQLFAIAMTGGEGSQEKKIEMLAGLFRDADALSARFIARIPLDKLRLGFSDMTILDALSWMAAGDKSLRDPLEAAYNVLPDIGFIAKTLKRDGIKGLSHVHAKVGAPILAALCQRIPTADEMIKKMGEVSVEPKYDGARIQIHVHRSNVESKKPKVSTYSRNLENTTAMFPELDEIGKELHAKEAILDGEAIGIDPKTGQFISFQDTMKRKRKHDIEATRAAIPLKFMVFDLLYVDGKDLLSVPLSERRRLLEKTVKPGRLLMVAPHIISSDAQEVREYHEEQLKKGLEGVVVKKWESPYEPGRRGYSWVKFKEVEGKAGKLTDTIDAVIMGYSRGEGKRNKFGIGMFLVGVRRGDSFVTITKIGTGVSDEQWREFYAKLEAIKVKNQPKEYEAVNKQFTPDVWVAPRIVVEVAGDDLTKSPAHGAGVAIRFPRLVRIRTDKSPRQATTVKEITQMYTGQFATTS
jgi:DNA ligase 1